MELKQDFMLVCMIICKKIVYLFIKFLICIFIISLNSCSNMSEKEKKDEILKVLFQQQASWNKGDLAGFMQGYWKSDSLRFIGKNDIKYGWETTLNHYKKKYYNKSIMGVLSFEVISLQLLNDNAAFMIGTFALKREIGDASGYFTLLWKKIDGNWVITTDHTP